MATGIFWKSTEDWCRVEHDHRANRRLASRSSGNVLVRYEDLIADPGSELRRILP
jgi:hypothetical protein